jgi:hypothetical protein
MTKPAQDDTEELIRLFSSEKLMQQYVGINGASPAPTIHVCLTHSPHEFVTKINYFMLLMFVLSPLLLPVLLLALDGAGRQSFAFVQSVQARERKGVS